MREPQKESNDPDSSCISEDEEDDKMLFSDHNKIPEIALRGRLWKMISRLDELKAQMLKNFKLNRGRPDAPFVNSCVESEIEI